LGHQVQRAPDSPTPRFASARAAADAWVARHALHGRYPDPRAGRCRAAAAVA
jgi:hypothetical protein